MTEALSILMLITGALFVSSVFSIAWERAPVWRAEEIAPFRVDFAHTVRRVDRLQPPLLLVTLALSIGFAISASGTASVFAGVAALCLGAILVVSTTRLVPIQNRISDPESDLSGAEVERLRTRWLSGHLIRTAFALVAFVLLVVAAVVA
jgi:hypothetical protein